MRCSGHDLLGRKQPRFDSTPNFVAGNAQLRSGFQHGEPFAAGCTGRFIALDFVDTAQRADAVAGPALALASAHAHAVERGSDVSVGPACSHRADDGHCLFRRALGVLSRLRLADADLRMLPALPMDGELNFLRIFVGGCDNIFDQCAQKPLPEAHVDIGIGPRCLEIMGQAREVRHIALIGLSIVEPRLAGLDAAKRRFPALLELRGNQSVIGITGSIAPLGQRGFVAGLLEVQFDHLSPLRFALEMHALRLQSRFDRHWWSCIVAGPA